jgi:acyl-CoA synthetase (AMP-forming)/AMP-acid ligase II
VSREYDHGIHCGSSGESAHASDFSIVSENLAKTYGDAECIVNVERDRRYSFREYHRLTNRIANMMRERLALRRGDVWLCILHNNSISLLSPFTAFKGEACACYTNTTDTLEAQARQIDLVTPKAGNSSHVTGVRCTRRFRPARCAAAMAQP